MTDDENPFRARFVDQAGEFAASLGLNRSVGQLYALLFMSPEPMCLDEMAEACDMSKGNVSINIRELERWGAARRVGVRGDRRDYYEANRDLPQIVIRRVQEGLTRRLSMLDSALDDATDYVKQMKGDPGRKSFYGERLAEVQKLHRSLRRGVANLDKLYAIGKRFL